MTTLFNRVFSKVLIFRGAFIVATGLILLPIAHPAATIHVPTDYSTIQAAIDVSSDGDEIVVSPGTYVENIHFNRKNIVLRSTEPTSPTVVAATIIDGNLKGSVVTFAGSETTSCVLTGFTITRGKATYGGGVRGNWTEATLEHNVITNNSGTYGTGIYEFQGVIRNNIISKNNQWALYWCYATIQNNSIIENGNGVSYSYGIVENNTISNTVGGIVNFVGVAQGNEITHNSAGIGGFRGDIINNNISYNGVGVKQCIGLIEGNEISYNKAMGINDFTGTIVNNNIFRNKGTTGAGIYSVRGSVLNNRVWENNAIDGAGIRGCSGPIVNNTIYNNFAANSGGGVYGCSGVIQNCIIFGNNAGFSYAQIGNSTIPSYSCIEDWDGTGIGNISDDPMFVLPEHGDFRLKEASPCIDAGSISSAISTDFEGDPRGYNGSVQPRGDGSDFDIGADEFAGIVIVPTPTPLPCVVNVPGDFGTIQEAINAAETNCEIIIAPGIYVENLTIDGKFGLILRSSNPEDPFVVASTIIDGNGTGAVIKLEGKLSSRLTITGLTIQNGHNRIGAGISGNNEFLVIENNIIKQNVSTYAGGGVAECIGTLKNNILFENYALTYGGGVEFFTGTIESNIITTNTATSGGGIHSGNGVIQYNDISGNHGGGISNFWDLIQYNLISNNFTVGDGGGVNICNNTVQYNIIENNESIGSGGGINSAKGVRRNIITNNHARYHGGGISTGYESIVEENLISSNSSDKSGGGIEGIFSSIQNNIISFNSSNEFGGGILIQGDRIRNNTIYGNSSGLAGGGLSESSYSGVTINNIVWANTAPDKPQINVYAAIPTYSCIQNYTSPLIRKNINSDPLLADPLNGDFHLLPGSPCIDAGAYIADLTTDFDGEPRPVHVVNDLRGDGSYFDIGADEAVFVTEESIRDHILGRLLMHPFVKGLSDFNGDGEITISDLIMFVNNAGVSEPLYLKAAKHESRR